MSQQYEFAGKISDINISRPESFKEAISESDDEKWKATMDKEISSYQEINT